MGKGSLVGILMSLALVGCTATEISSPANTESGGQQYSGYVYDIDYLKNQGWTQILIMPLSGGTNLVVQTDNAFVQAVLETALLDKLPAEVAYYETGNAGPVKILAATVSAGSPGCPHKDCVERVTCVASGECSARITGEMQMAKTKEIRVLGVLLTAVNKKKPIEYLTLDASHTIVRVKINVPSA